MTDQKTIEIDWKNSIHYLTVVKNVRAFKDHNFARRGRWGQMFFLTCTNPHPVKSAWALARNLKKMWCNSNAPKFQKERLICREHGDKLNVVTVDLLTSQRTFWFSPEEFIAAVESKSKKNSRALLLAKPVVALFDSRENPATIGDKIFYASSYGQAIAGTIVGYTKSNIVVAETNGRLRYISYSRFKKGTLKI